MTEKRPKVKECKWPINDKKWPRIVILGFPSPRLHKDLIRQMSKYCSSQYLRSTFIVVPVYVTCFLPRERHDTRENICQKTLIYALYMSYEKNKITCQLLCQTWCYVSLKFVRANDRIYGGTIRCVTWNLTDRHVNISPEFMLGSLSDHMLEYMSGWAEYFILYVRFYLTINVRIFVCQHFWWMFMCFFNGVDHTK